MKLYEVEWPTITMQRYHVRASDSIEAHRLVSMGLGEWAGDSDDIPPKQIFLDSGVLLPSDFKTTVHLVELDTEG